MKIRKLFFITIASVGLCLSILPISFAQNISTPLTRPEPEYNLDSSGLTFKQYWIGEINKTGFPQYILIEFISNGGIPQKGRYNKDNIPLWNGGTSGNYLYPRICLCDQSYENYIDINIYDLESGNLFYSGKSQMYGISYNGYYGSYRYINGFKPSDVIRGFVVSDIDFLIPSENGNKYFGSEFVTWSTNEPEVPDQIQLKSPLSEPVADKYNSYAVLDDHLIWISWRINGIYTRSASIENISEIYSYNAQINEQGTGLYSGNQSGSTDSIEIPTQSISGSYSGSSEDTSILTDGNFDQFGFYRGTEYDVGSGYTNSSQGELYLNNLYLSGMNFSGNHSGVTSGAIIPGIDFSGINQGNVQFNSSGTISLNDIEYYPVEFNHNDIFEYFRLYCLPTDTDNFVFWLAPDRSFVPLASTNQLLVNMDFFYSEFDLDGNYIRSTFHTVTETDIGLFDAFQTEEPIHSVKFYGIDFFNLDNLPFNFSSVLWQYDFEFKQWRDNMYSKLSDIYNVLSQSESLSSYQGKEFGSQLNANNAMDDLSYNSNSVDSNINSLLGESINKLGSDGGVLRSLTANIIALGNGKIFSLLIISLAAGVIILLLGKNKND